MKLLLVDDVELFLNLEKSFLDRESFITETAQSGKEALEKVETELGTVEEVRYFIDFIRTSKRGICR